MQLSRKSKLKDLRCGNRETKHACYFLCRPAAAAAKIHWHNYKGTFSGLPAMDTGMITRSGERTITGEPVEHVTGTCES